MISCSEPTDLPSASAWSETTRATSDAPIANMDTKLPAPSAVASPTSAPSTRTRTRAPGTAVPAMSVSPSGATRTTSKPGAGDSGAAGVSGARSSAPASPAAASSEAPFAAVSAGAAGAPSSPGTAGRAPAVPPGASPGPAAGAPEPLCVAAFAGRSSSCGASVATDLSAGAPGTGGYEGGITAAFVMSSETASGWGAVAVAGAGGTSSGAAGASVRASGTATVSLSALVVLSGAGWGARASSGGDPDGGRGPSRKGCVTQSPSPRRTAASAAQTLGLADALELVSAIRSIPLTTLSPERLRDLINTAKRGQNLPAGVAMFQPSLSVCVFCGSRPGDDPAYTAAARDLGTAIATEGWELVYGAGDVGLMGAVADAATAAGAKTLGVIPVHLLSREKGRADLSRYVVTENMHERKKVMYMNSHAIAVLPGGAGSLDEFFEVLTWRQLGLHDKPIYLLNTDEYWTPLMQILDHVIAEDFAAESLKGFVHPVDTVQDLRIALRAALS